MRFRNFDKLRGFCLVARYDSFTRAAQALNLTKGAVSHQIDRLESELGFQLFTRRKQGIELTPNGRQMLRVAELGFDSIEQEISHLRRRSQSSITIGMATYFASRWLSPRLMRFITRHPGVRMRIQPVVGPLDLRSGDLDLAIRWGKGGWIEKGMRIELIFPCPALLTSSIETGRRIESEGIEAVIGELQLLHDVDGSQAWADWFDEAGLKMREAPRDLVIPDPNVRVQAVIDGQGIGLYDELVADEVRAGRLYQYQSVQLRDYGFYLVYAEDSAPGSPIMQFRDWMLEEAMS